MSTRRQLALFTASLFLATDSFAALIQQTAVATHSTLAFGPQAVQTFSTAAGQTTMATGIVLNPLVLSGLLTPSFGPSFGQPGGTLGHLSLGGTGGITPGTPVGPGGVGGPLTPTAGSVFQPFPFAGAAAPVAEHRGSVFNPFPFEGATAPLGFVGGVAGPGAAPYRANDTGASPGPSAGVGLPAGGQTALPTIQSTVTLNGHSTSQLLVTMGSLPNGQSAGPTLIENPEPSSAGLLVLGLAGLAYWLRRRPQGLSLKHTAGR